VHKEIINEFAFSVDMIIQCKECEYFESGHKRAIRKPRDRIAIQKYQKLSNIGHVLDRRSDTSF
jgi:hypothetical protein